MLGDAQNERKVKSWYLMAFHMHIAFKFLSSEVPARHLIMMCDQKVR
jgi:hypothetical protein